MADNPEEEQQEQQNPVEALQQHLNAMVTLLNQQPFESQLLQVQQAAQSSFDNFDGNPNTINPEMFDYMQQYSQLNGQITQVDEALDQHLGITMDIMDEHGNHIDNADEFKRFQDELIDQWNRIEARRNHLQQFLLDGNYVRDEEQLEEGYDGQVPWRWLYDDPQVAQQLVDGHLHQIQEWLDDGPTPDNFQEARQSAQEALDDYVEPNQGEELSAEMFGYLGLFQAANDSFQQIADSVRDSLRLVNRIANHFPEDVDDERAQLLQELWQRFEQVNTARSEAEDFLLREGFARQNQLERGYDGRPPPAFTRQTYRRQGLGGRQQ